MSFSPPRRLFCDPTTHSRAKFSIIKLQSEADLSVKVRLIIKSSILFSFLILLLAHLMNVRRRVDGGSDEMLLHNECKTLLSRIFFPNWTLGICSCIMHARSADKRWENIHMHGLLLKSCCGVLIKTCCEMVFAKMFDYFSLHSLGEAICCDDDESCNCWLVCSLVNLF